MEFNHALYDVVLPGGISKKVCDLTEEEAKDVLCKYINLVADIAQHAQHIEWSLCEAMMTDPAEKAA